MTDNIRERLENAESKKERKRIISQVLNAKNPDKTIDAENGEVYRISNDLSVKIHEDHIKLIHTD